MKIKALIFGAIIFPVILISATYYNFRQPLADEEIIIEINKGDADHKVFQNLHEFQIVSYPKLHILAVKIIKKFNKDFFFKSGEYKIEYGDNYISLIKKMLEGDIYFRKFTVTEGETVHNVIKNLKENPYFTGEVTVIPEEGRILPETYFFRKGIKRDDQIRLMMEDMEEVLDKIWQTRQENLPIKNKRELLILASIVEKETGVASERDHVAGVFINRLNRKMRLQSDPTVIYAITLGKYKLERPLSKRDLRRDSPYNSYLYSGLPPTPIANPGKLAIFATANPKKTRDLYFVSNGRGEHLFSENLRQHNNNVLKLRRYERSLKEKK